MADTKRSEPIWVLVGTSNRYGWMEEITGMPAHIDDQDRVMARRGSWDWQDNPYNLDLANLECTTGASSGHNSQDGCYWRIAYKEVFSIESPELADRLGKTLRHIQKRMHRDYDADGNAKTFGQYVLRFCRAIGAQGIIVKRENVDASTYGCKDDYGFSRNGSIVFAVDAMCAQVDARWAKAA